MQQSSIFWLRAWFFLLLLLFGWVFYVTAWVTEDAFITFRVIDNLINGYGPRWNIDERVQVFTHPLWMFLLVPIVAVCGDPYWAAIGLSAACLVLFLVLVFRLLGGINFASLLVALCFMSSAAFVDYSSSGLENPLTHVFLVLFLLKWVSGKKDYFGFFLIFSLLYLNRPDSIIFVVPPLFFLIFADFSAGGLRFLKATVPAVLAGLAPMLLWLIFSLVYYGAFVPNTAIAKVQNGLDIYQSIHQGWSLIQYSLENDVGTLVFIGLGFGLGFFDKRYISFSFGILLYFVYLFYVGGDYMAGRFLTAPLVVSLLIFGLMSAGAIRKNKNFGYYGLALALIFFATKIESHFSLDYYSAPYIEKSGVADERGFYYPFLGVRPTLFYGNWLRYDFLQEGVALRGRTGKYLVKCNIGMTPYAAGADYVFIDPLALADGFIARLPAASGSRVGHYERSIPTGYLESRIFYKNLLQEPALRRLWDDTHIVLRGDIFTWDRFAAIFRLNFQKELYLTNIKNRDEIHFNGRVYKKTSYDCLGNSAVITVDAATLQIIQKKDLGLD